MINDDGDIIRGLGFVALHASYLEGAIDDLLHLFNVVDSFDTEYVTWPVDRKIKQARKKLRDIGSEKALEMESILKVCKDRLVWRNELLHGRIYGGQSVPRLVSGRPNVPTRAVESSELYQLANDLSTLKGVLYGFTEFDLPIEFQANGL